MHKHLILEACVESLEEAILAEKKGAGRIELCSRLDLDGLTPDRKLIELVIHTLNIPVKVMIRPLAGDFVYTTDEFSGMKNIIQFCKHAGAQGVVFGMLDKSGQLNFEQIQLLAELAAPLEVTIHKAIDQTPDPVASLSSLLQIGRIASILTSGGATTAMEGKDVIKKMLQVSEGKINIIAAGKITNQNLDEIHQLIGAREYHGRRIVGQLI